MLLFTLAVAILCVAATVIACVARLTAKPAPLAAGLAQEKGGLKLETARETALAYAVRWQADAQLVGAVIRWQPTGGDRLEPGQAARSFSFYSPAAGQIQTITVNQAGAQPVREVPVSVAPVPVDADWSLDSHDLWFIFMAYGGEDFLRAHPSATLHFRLSGQDAGGPIWYLSAIAPRDRRSFVVGVDAFSRQVVLTS